VDLQVLGATLTKLDAWATLRPTFVRYRITRYAADALTYIYIYIYIYICVCVYVCRYSEQATGWTIWVSNPGRSKRYFSFPKCPDWLWDPPSPQFGGYQGNFMVIKRPGRDTEHLLPSTTEVKNGWSCTFMVWTETTLLDAAGTRIFQKYRDTLKSEAPKGLHETRFVLRITNSSCHLTKFSLMGDLAPRVCAYI
jgi:hypothetical protein